MFLVLCSYISSTEVGTKFFLLCCNQVSEHSRRAQKSILEKVLWAGLRGQFQQDCAESWPVLCVRTSPQPFEQQLPVGPPCWFMVPVSSCLRGCRWWCSSAGARGDGAGCPKEFITECTDFETGWGSLNPVWVPLGDEQGGIVGLHYPQEVKVMWRNAYENHAGSKTYPDIREDQGKGNWDGFGFPSSPTASSTSVPNVKAKGTPFSPFPEPKYFQAFIYPILWLDCCLFLSLPYFLSSFKIQFSHLTPRINGVWRKESRLCVYFLNRMGNSW